MWKKITSIILSTICVAGGGFALALLIEYYNAAKNNDAGGAVVMGIFGIPMSIMIFAGTVVLTIVSLILNRKDGKNIVSYILNALTLLLFASCGFILAIAN